MPPSKPLTTQMTFKKIAIIGKPGATGIAGSLTQLADFLQEAGVTVLFEAETARNIGRADGAGLTPDQIGRAHV